MGKKIIIGSMLVLTLLLLMPSIPAIQQRTIEDKAYSDFVEKLEDVEIFDDVMKFSILFVFVIMLALHRNYRAFRIWDFAQPGGYPNPVEHPLLAFYGSWLFLSMVVWIEFWMNISDKLGWNWNR